MKKFFALALALVLTCALAVTCFAATANTTTPATGAVKATYVAGATNTDKVYSVDVTFGDMNFTYTDTATGAWNPENHSYPDTVPAAWNKTSADITVKNHSNAAVAVTVAYAKDAGYTGAVNGAISEGSFDLESAEGTAVAEAPAKTVTFTISGAPENTMTTATTVGTITVTIAAK